LAAVVIAADKTILRHKVPDKLYIECRCYLNKGEKINWNKPVSFTQKLQWLKLYDRNPLYTKLADKYAVREYIAQKIGENYLMPVLGAWNSFDAIDFATLPRQFVLKCSHDSGSVVLCTAKETFDIASAKEKLEKRLKINYYFRGREWAYKNIPPRIIAEKYMTEGDGTGLKDYKFFCFNGEPKLIKFCTRNYTATGMGRPSVAFFNLDWTELPFTVGYEKVTSKIENPENFNVMVEICKNLSAGIPFVRVDLYNIRGQIYFGEMTFYPSGGNHKFNPPEWDAVLGTWLKLPEKAAQKN
jgi:hypothetical protein